MSVVVNGVDVGYYETSESNSEFYDYQESQTHQAQGIDSEMVNEGTHSAYILVHHSTSDDTWAMYIHHYTGPNTTGKAQAQVTWSGFNEVVSSADYLFVTGDGVDQTAHGSNSYIYASGEPVRNAGGGSYVYETGTTLTPASAYTVVQDEVEDNSSSGDTGDDKYDLNSNGDPVTRHYYNQNRGDGGGYRMAPGQATITMELTTLDDGRDDGSPVPAEWVGVGPSNSTTKTAGAGSSVTVELNL